MDEKELEEIEVIYDNAAAVMKIPDVPLHEFYAAMTLAYKRIPALIQAIRDRDKNAEILRDVAAEAILELSGADRVSKDSIISSLTGRVRELLEGM